MAIRHRRGLCAALSAGALVIADLLTLTLSGSAAPPTGFFAVAAGGTHSCAIVENAPASGQGYVWCWGANDSGQLGTHTDTDVSETPVLVNLIDDAVQITAGNRHTCVVRSDATVWCWGGDNAGQLGDGATEDSATPVPAIGLSDVVQVKAGRAHTCALTIAGEVSCWGSNAFGALGDASITDRDLALNQNNNVDSLAMSADGQRLYAAVESDNEVVVVSAAGNILNVISLGLVPGSFPVSVAPTSDGSWFLSRGQTIERRDDTGAVLQSFNIALVCTSIPCELQGIAADGHGTLYATWVNSLGVGTLAAFSSDPAGDGDVLTTPTWERDTVDPNPDFPPDLFPTDLASRTDERGVTRVYIRGNGVIVVYSAAGFTLTSMHGTGVDDCGGAIGGGLIDLGVDQDGDVLVPAPNQHCINRFGPSGTFLDSFGVQGPAPGQLDDPGDIVADAVGNLFVLDAGNRRIQKFDRSGVVDANWGRRQFTSVPRQVLLDVGATDPALGTGAHHTCVSPVEDVIAGSPTPTTYCWGDNGAGQLDPAFIGSIPHTSIPRRVGTAYPDVVGGSDHSCGIFFTSVRCWGDNGNAQLGDGTTDPHNTSVVVSGLGDPVALSAGSAFTCALRETATVRCWGSDAAGQLGNGLGVGGCTPRPAETSWETTPAVASWPA